MRKLINRRLSVENSMPPLAEACAPFKGFKTRENLADQIFELLLPLIQRCRGKEAKRFYTMRELAAFFGVSLFTAETVYHRLNAEGVLIKVRSSQTMIAARAPRQRFAVRGVVCMPIWLPGFLQFLDWRRWFSQLEEEISHYRFVLEPIFYKQGEEVSPAFVDRVLKFNPDYILWHSPGVGDITTMQSFTDTGIPLIVVQYSLGQFPGKIYRQSYERALQQGLKEWEQGGEVDDIIIPHDHSFHFDHDIGKYCSLPYRYKKAPAQEKDSLAVYLRKLAPNSRTGLFFYDDIFYTKLCIKVPEMMLELIRRHRVMVWREVLVTLEVPPDLEVDALLFPWKQLARRIAMDLNQAKSSLTYSPAVFEAEWHPRLPLKKITQSWFQG